MYTVFKNSRPAGNLKFNSYEAARQYARKRIRKLFGSFPKGANPSINVYGYVVRKV